MAALISLFLLAAIMVSVIVTTRQPRYIDLSKDARRRIREHENARIRILSR